MVDLMIQFGQIGRMLRAAAQHARQLVWVSLSIALIQTSATAQILELVLVLAAEQVEKPHARVSRAWRGRLWLAAAGQKLSLNLAPFRLLNPVQ